MEKYKNYNPGEILGIATKEEVKELLSIMREKRAIKNLLDDLFQKGVEAEAELIKGHEEWWARMRKKHNLPNEKELRPKYLYDMILALSVSYETREIFVTVRSK